MDFAHLTFHAVYIANGKEHTTDRLQNADFTVKLQTNGDCLFASLTPHTAVSFKVLQFILPRTFQKTERLFCGFMPWLFCGYLYKGFAFRIPAVYGIDLICVLDIAFGGRQF